MGWSGLVKNEGGLYRFKEERNILHKIKQKRANWIGYILRRRCLHKVAIEGNRRDESQGRCKPLLNDRTVRRTYRNLKHETPQSTVWRTHV
jgi:hypothetical protein